MLVVEVVTLTGRLLTVLLTPLLVVQAQTGLSLKYLVIIGFSLGAFLVFTAGIGWVAPDAVIATVWTIGFFWFVAMILTVADIVRHGAWEPTYDPYWIACATSFTGLLLADQFDQAFGLFTEQQQLESSAGQFHDRHMEECQRLGGVVDIVDVSRIAETPLAATRLLKPQLKDLDPADGSAVAVVVFQLQPTAAVSKPLACMRIRMTRESGEVRITGVDYLPVDQPLRGNSAYSGRR